MAPSAPQPDLCLCRRTRPRDRGLITPSLTPPDPTPTPVASGGPDYETEDEALEYLVRRPGDGGYSTPFRGSVADMMAHASNGKLLFKRENAKVAHAHLAHTHHACPHHACPHHACPRTSLSLYHRHACPRTSCSPEPLVLQH